MGASETHGGFKPEQASLLGFGLFLAWGTLTSSLTVSLDVAALSSSVGRLFVISPLNAVCYLAIAAYVHATGRNLWTRPTIAVCCALAVLFVPLEYAAAASGAFALDLVAIVAHSLAYVGLFLAWNVQIARQQPRVAWTTYAASMVLSSALSLAMQAAPVAGLAVAVLLLALLQGFLLARCDHTLEVPEAADDEPATWRIPWRPILLIIVFSLAFSAVQHYEGRLAVSDELGRLVAALATLACAVALFTRFDENIIARVSTVLMVTALLICGIEDFADPYGAAKLLASIAYYGFMLYVYLALSTICYRYQARVEWLFGIVQAIYSMMTAPSSLLGNVLQGADGLVVDVAMDGIAVAVLTLSLFLIMNGTFSSTWGIKASRQVTTQEGERMTLPEGADYLRDNAYCCTLIAKEFGLTRREEEVLSLMAEGKTFAQIEALLYIAHGTLRAHVQHLYAKLDVHSREEACAFVESWKARG